MSPVPFDALQQKAVFRPPLRGAGANWHVADKCARNLGRSYCTVGRRRTGVPLGGCAYLESTHVPHGLGFMFQGGRVVRIDVSKVGIKTASGVGVGDTEDRVKQLYSGHITIEPHPYEPEGRYIKYSPANKDERQFGIVFETDGARVTSFRTGTRAAIALIEGCS